MAPSASFKRQCSPIHAPGAEVMMLGFGGVDDRTAPSMKGGSMALSDWLWLFSFSLSLSLPKRVDLEKNPFSFSSFLRSSFFSPNRRRKGDRDPLSFSFSLSFLLDALASSAT